MWAGWFEGIEFQPLCYVYEFVLNVRQVLTSRQKFSGSYFVSRQLDRTGYNHMDVNESQEV
jgi:hypothetical protein